MKKLKLKLKFIVKFLGFYAYKVFPMPSALRRDRNKWLFSALPTWKSSNNAKSLFIRLRDEDPSIDAIWIAQNREEEKAVRLAGFPSFVWYSLRGLFHCLTAGVYIYIENNDVNRMTSRSAFCVCLWHGVGIKKLMGLDSDFYCHSFGFKKEPAKGSFLERMKVSLQIYKKPDALLVPSRFQAEELFIPMFRIAAEQIIATGYPRNEMLSWSHGKIREYVVHYGSRNNLELLDRIAVGKYRKVYIYMPTKRERTHDSELSMAGFDFDKLEAALAAKDSLFIIKLHPAEKWDFIGTWRHIVRISNIYDTYPLLPYTDCLITDYSSIYSDYILMDKEIILFPFDKEEYMSTSIDILNYDTYYLGTKVYTFEALLSLIREEADCHLPADDRATALRIYQEYHGNGLDLVREIKKRQSAFLERKGGGLRDGKQG